MIAKKQQHRTLQGRVVPPGWTVERLGDEQQQYETWRYTSDATRLCVVETIKPYGDGRQWQHISVSYWDRLPSWGDLAMVKRIWMGHDTTALQVLPPASRWVSIHPFCLHLFRCLDGDVTPEFSTVIEGVRGI